MRPPPPFSTLFPYTTLFRSVQQHRSVRGVERGRARESFRGRGDVPECRNVRQDRSGDHDVDLRRDVRSDRKSTRLNSSHITISYAVFCLKKKKTARSNPTFL